MDQHSSHSHPQSPSHLPASHMKYHHPYFTPEEVNYLSEKQRGKMSANNEKFRQQACGFIEAVGAKIGFPRKTIATAQCLYVRFHLYFPRKDFNYIDVSLACMYVSSKMHDTLKKPRDILMVSYSVRFPELAARSKVVGGEVEMDPATVEQDRQRLLGIERLVLETVCFNFTVRLPFSYVIKVGRDLKASKRLIRSAWRLAIDSHRTLAPLQYPPHVIAIACIYLAALLVSFEQQLSTDPEPGAVPAHELVELLGRKGDWEQKYRANLEHLEEISHHLLDLLIHAAQNPSANTSPSTPSSPSPHGYLYASPRSQVSSQLIHTAAGQAAPRPQPLARALNHDALMRLKIHLRDKEQSALPREPPGVDPLDGISDIVDTQGYSTAEGTVRFMFGPKHLVGEPGLQ